VVRIENLGPFERLELRLDRPWTVLLGNNGTGKSTILKAIALALSAGDEEAAKLGTNLLSNRAGSGFVEMDHGKFPIPPPAVAELLRDKPIYAGDIEGEFVTPTGAAIITSVCDRFENVPAMKIGSTGYGAGTRNPKGFPNALRVLVGETQAISAGDETLLMIETNIDDMSPQIFGYVIERALELGALDCYLTQTQMKKNRPGMLLSILCRPAEREKFLELLFSETTTIGVRSYEVQRRALARETISVQTQFGPIDVKVVHVNGSVRAMPEFEQCRSLAAAANVPLREVQEAAELAFRITIEPREQ